MKIIFIRHGDPDYSIDSLTERGRIEAELVGERLKDLPCDAVFCSPLGRAKDTMQPYIEKTGKGCEKTPLQRDSDILDLQTRGNYLFLNVLAFEFALSFIVSWPKAHILFFCICRYG